MYPHPNDEDKDIFLITRLALEHLIVSSGINIKDLEDIMSSYEEDSNMLSSNLAEEID